MLPKNLQVTTDIMTKEESQKPRQWITSVDTDMYKLLLYTNVLDLYLHINYVCVIYNCSSICYMHVASWFVIHIIYSLSFFVISYYYFCMLKFINYVSL